MTTKGLTMKFYIQFIGGLLLIVGLSVLFFETTLPRSGMAIAAPPEVAAEIVEIPTLPSPHVKVMMTNGHGSAVHIGNGYFITADHVPGREKTAVLVADDGSKRQAEVLWGNAAFDIALLRIKAEDADWLDAAELDCGAPIVGQKIKAFGNPNNIEAVFMSGEIVGGVREWEYWREMVPVDMTIIPGMSGGGVVNYYTGEVVGIAVGVMTDGFSLTGLGAIVPASTVCMLMGRVA